MTEILSSEERQKVLALWIRRTPETDKRLVRGISEYYTEEQKSEDKATHWAWQRLTDLCEGNPRLGLELILDIARSSKGNAHVWTRLASGPLEDLVKKHGEELIDDMELAVEKDQDLSWILRGMHPYADSPSLKERLLKIDDLSDMADPNYYIPDEKPD